MKYLTYAAIPFMAASLSTHAVTVDQVNSQVQQLNERIAKSNQRFRINGFASFGLTQSDEEFSYNGINNEANFRRNTKAGIQMSFGIDEQTSVVAQLVSRGTDDFDTKMEWAYLKHQFSSNLTAKVGRIRTPIYMLSEYLDVGYAVPWATMPQETYEALSIFSNMDGADLTYSMDVGSMIGTAQVAYGRVDYEGISLKNVMSLGLTLAGDDWQTRFAYSQADTSSDLGGVALFGDDKTVKGFFTSLGATYDPGDIYVAAETTLLEVDGSLADATSSYGTFGYRIGAWMPHLTYAVTESTDDEDRTVNPALPAQVQGQAQVYAALFNRNTQRIGLGARWDFTSGAAIKFQYDIITTDDAPGLFGSSAEDATAYVGAAATGSEPDSTNIISITIDTVF
ncbi:MAG: hypothetical protein JXR16_14035 [Bermanella sp.]